MSRRFYLSPHKPIRTETTRQRRLALLPSWVKVAVPVALVLVAAVIALDVLDLWPRRPALGRRYQPSSAAVRDTTTQPVDTAVRPTVEASAAVAPVAPEAATPQVQRPIRLQVLNGCGVRGLAKVVTPALRAKGFDVRETRNANHFRYERTVLIDRVGRPELARIVADSLGMDGASVTTESARNLADIDVTVIVGADYESLRLDLRR
jgi:hypothetical protein